MFYHTIYSINCFSDFLFKEYYYSIIYTKFNKAEEQYKKDLNDADNYDGVITHLEPDILECEVKWA